MEIRSPGGFRFPTGFSSSQTRTSQNNSYQLDQKRTVIKAVLVSSKIFYFRYTTTIKTSKIAEEANTSVKEEDRLLD